MWNSDIVHTINENNYLKVVIVFPITLQLLLIVEV